MSKEEGNDLEEVSTSTYMLALHEPNQPYTVACTHRVVV